MIDFMSMAKNKTKVEPYTFIDRESDMERKEMSAFDVKQAKEMSAFDVRQAVEMAANALRKQFGKQVRKYAEEVRKLEVTDDETEKQAISKAGEIKDLTNQMENWRKDKIGIHDQYVRRLNALVKTFKDILEPAMNDLKRKVGDHQFKKELNRREKEKKALEEQKKLQEQIRKEADEKGLKVPEMPDALPVEKRQTITRADDGSSAHIRTEWAYEILDFSKVPDEYKMIDDKKIKAMIKAGARTIEGVRIFEKPVTVLKTA